MRKALTLTLFAFATMAVYACSGAQTKTASSSEDVCTPISAGPPPVCPEGCRWNGTECRKDSGVIVHDARSIDGGTPLPSQ